MGRCSWSEQDPCFMIAEIGVNHGGSLGLAKEMIDAARNAGADAVKFQTFTADTLVTPGTPKVRYQESTTSPHESHFEMIRNLELAREHHVPLLDHCHRLGLEFISTPYDLDSARFLDTLGVKTFKTASADIVDLPLLRFLAGTGKRVIVATGMATLGEVEQAVSLFQGAENPHLVLLHCVSNYPCSDEGLNLRALRTLEYAFGYAVGFSDHSRGSQAAVVSRALGASVIEKHFTLDRDLPGPDHQASSTPEEFAELVRAVRRAELSLGSPLKSCQDEERQMALVSRKSITLRTAIKAGERLTEKHVTMKRPGTGLYASELTNVLGKQARRDLPQDTLLTMTDLE